MRSIVARRLASSPLVVGMWLNVTVAASRAWATTEPAETTVEQPTTYAELTRNAMAHEDAREYADAARSFSAAFALLREEAQFGLEGEITVNNAVDNYQRAQQEGSEFLVLLEQEAQLLEQFTRIRSTAHEAGKADPMPPEFTLELERVRAKIDEFRRVQEQARAAELARAREAIRAAKADAREQEDDGHQVAPEPAPPPPVEPEPVDLSRRKVTAALLGSGLVAVVGGASVLGGGIWVFGAAEERHDDQLTMLDRDEYPDEATIRERLEQWHNRGRGIATGLTVGGAVLAGVGIGLTTWGAVRLRRRGPGSDHRASLIVPMASSRSVCVTAAVKF